MVKNLRSTGHSASGWGERRTKTVTWHDPADTAAVAATLSGIEFLRALRDGVMAPPPIASLLGMQFARGGGGEGRLRLRT